MNEMVALIIAIDIVVTVGVVALLVRRAKIAKGIAGPAGSAVTAISHFRELAAFAKEQHQRIGDYMRANWSGDPAQLPGALEGLLDRLEEEARAKGLGFDRDALKTLVATSLRSHRIARPNDVGNALERVA